jgi:hypothetical protein
LGLDTDTIKTQYDDVYKYIKQKYVERQSESIGDILSESDAKEVSEYMQRVEEFLDDMTARELFAVSELFSSDDADFKNIFENYSNVLEEAKQAGVDFSKTTYGNINTNARQVLEWNSENLKKYKDEIMSWEPDDANWDNVKKGYENTISTVMGAWDTFEIDGKEVDIAFSPILQTDGGAELLSSDTVGTYIDSLITKATDDGKWDETELITLDAEGIEIDGQKISGILADIGETAEATAEQMHFVGENGALALAESELFALIEERAKLQEALNFESNIEVDTTALEVFNTALTESASAMGLSEEAIDSLNAKYSELKGYDPDTLFERTGNGIKVNRKELAKLEKEYNNLTKSEVQEHLDALTDKYNDVTAEIDKCANASERAQLISERDGYASKIKELAEYQAQLEGVTGAYQRWLDAQNAPEDYDGYELVATSREGIADEIDRGFISNASKEYIDLLSGKDLRGGTIDDYANAWGELDDKVTGAGHSINDFFTVNDDGDITATGIDRFFESLRTDFEGSVAKFNEESGKWEYDFSQENLSKIQKEWGMGIEAIELLLEAAASAGYDIDWGSILEGVNLDTSSFETLVSVAEAAQSALNEIDGFGDIDFNFTATGVEEAESEIEKARQAFSQFINADGTVNLKAEGAEEMQFILTTLIIQKQQLSTPAIMKVDTSQIDQAKTDVIDVITAAQQLQTAYENYEIAISTGVDVEKAKSDLSIAIEGMQGTSVDVRADLKLPTNEDLEAAKGSIGDIKVGAALDETSIGTIATQIQTQCTPEVIAKVTGIDETAVTNGEGGRQVKYTPEHSEVDAYINGLTDINKKIIFKYTTEGSKPNPKNIERTITYKYETEGERPKAYGTAYANGSTSGRAFVRGNWGIKGSGTALGGELAPELLIRNGEWQLIGKDGAEFFHYQPNDIIFNAAQTESLFKYGGIKGAKPRGKMLAGGSAFADGSSPTSGKAFWRASAFSSNFATKRLKKKAVKDTTKEEAKGAISSVINAAVPNTIPNWSATSKESDFVSERDSNKSPSKGGGGKDKAKDDFEETFDWIVTKIDRIERAIDELDLKANSVYKNWSVRNNALIEEIDKVGEEIEIQQAGYERYLEEANSVGLDESWAEKVRNGKIDIEKVNDEDLAEKIKEYQNWYEKAINCRDAVDDLKEKESELYAQRFENVQTQYESILQGYEHTETMLNEYISQAEEKGHIVSKKYYEALIANEKSNIEELKKEQADLIAMRDEAVASGTIAKHSEEWYNMCAEIDSVTQSIEESTTALLEFDNAIREIDWSIFDLIQERISGVTEETDFLIDLMSNKKLFDDKGKLTSQGLATMGLHAQNYNTHMYAADTYAEEIAKLDTQIAKDPYDQELINRRNELIGLQRESILAAEGEKNAIRDMVEEGINLELDALQELIDKKNEELESEKDLYEYQKKVKEQTEEIASLEKRMAAYSGDDSEEAKQKIQQIKVDLENARQDLQETEYDKLIDDTSVLLDSLYTEYELVLNTRLDNIDNLLSQVIESINATTSADGAIATALGSDGAISIAISSNATSIKDTLASEAKNVGVTLSSAMNSIWNTGDGNVKSVLTMYGEDFKTKSTTIITTLNGIKVSVNSMISSLNKEAEKKTTANKTTTSAKKNPTSSSNKATSTATKKSSGDGKPKIGDKVKFVSGQYYYDSQGTKPLGSKYQGKEVYITNINEKDWATHPIHISTGKKLGSGDLGWLKKNQISGYATGKKNLLDDEIAWTQENGQEFIVRPSDGAILTPIAKRDSVLNTFASNNIWDMANSPADFIKDNLKLDTANVPSGANVNNTYTQHIDNVTFSMPNVHGYNELLTEMQRDKNFEKLILSMTIDRINGKSGLGKGKSIR